MRDVEDQASDDRTKLESQSKHRLRREEAHQGHNNTKKSKNQPSPGPWGGLGPGEAS